MSNFAAIKGNIIRTCVYLFIFILMFTFSYVLLNSFYKVCNINIDIKGLQMGNTPIEIFYITEKGDSYKQENSVSIQAKSPTEFSYNGSINLPIDKTAGIRIDIGNGIGKVTLKKLSYRDYSGYCNFDIEKFENFSLHDISIDSFTDDGVILNTFSSDGISEPDPYIEINNYKLTPYKKNNNIIYAFGIALIITAFAYKFIELRPLYLFFVDLFHSRRFIMSLAKNDFKTRYAGSYFGIIWAFVQPICTILVFWFVFQVGFRNTDVGNVPFVCWFSCGLIPWFFFSDAWNNATNSLIEYSYLVKKVVFKIHILPLIKIISTFFVHIFFIMFMIFIFLCYKIMPNIYWFQVLYYCFCAVMLTIALSFITVSLVVFFKDLGQIMNIILQFGMWLTPIMWSIDTIPQKFIWIFKLNPMYYVVQGYRDSFIYNVPFYSNIKQTIYFWAIVIILMSCGSYLFKKLKPHFADVL